MLYWRRVDGRLLIRRELLSSTSRIIQSQEIAFDDSDHILTASCQLSVELGTIFELPVCIDLLADELDVLVDFTDFELDFLVNRLGVLLPFLGGL